MKKLINLAIVGATGAVGQQTLKILAQRDIELGDLYLLASERSSGQSITFRGKEYKIQALEHFDFSSVDVASFSVGADLAAKFVPKATATGCIVIDKSSEFRYDPDVPLIVPEINPEDISLLKKRNIIANPNCSTIQMVLALAPIHRAVGIERINVCTYQAVFGAGLEGVEELLKQSKAMLAGEPLPAAKVHRETIAFNCVPAIGSTMDNDYTEEIKMIWETHKILHDDTIKINVTAVRVPVMNAHAEAIHLETREKLTKKQALDLLRKAPGIALIENGKAFLRNMSMPVALILFMLGRVREDMSHPRGLNLWVVGDNLRKGAALNAIQIIELVLNSF